MPRLLHNKKGSQAFLIVLVVGAAGLVVGGALQMVRSQERKVVNRAIAKDRPLAVMDAVYSRVISDLGDEISHPTGGGAADGTLDHLLKVDSTIFNAAHPRIYGKGEFQLELREAGNIKMFTGNPSSQSVNSATVSGATSTATLLITAESDPRAWLESTSTPCTYLLHIRLNTCRGAVTGRIPFPSGNTGLGLEFNQLCPTESVIPLALDTYLNTSSPVFATSAPMKCGVVDDPNRDWDYTILPIHNQQGTVPDCPSGFRPLWFGYSHLGISQDSGYTASQDLSSAGSCWEGGNEIPTIETTEPWSWYQTPLDTSLWLISQASSGANFAADVKTEDGRNLALSTVGRCTVCEGKLPVIARHSYTTSTPDCFPGWRLLWQGYSFGMASWSGDRESPQALGGPGSCLRSFLPSPVLRCDASNCKFEFDSANQMWIANSSVITSPGAINNDHGSNTARNADRVSRCSVCMKEEE